MMKVACVVHHGTVGAADIYGDPPIAYDTTTDERCYLAQQSRAEDDGVEVERWSVYFLPSTDVDANDMVDVTGMRLQLLGSPWRVIDPVTGWETHIEATAVRRR